MPQQALQVKVDQQRREQEVASITQSTYFQSIKLNFQSIKEEDQVNTVRLQVKWGAK